MLSLATKEPSETYWYTRAFIVVVCEHAIVSEDTDLCDCECKGVQSECVNMSVGEYEQLHVNEYESM